MQRLDAVSFVPISLPRSRDRASLTELARSLELPDAVGHSIMDSVAGALSYWKPRLQPGDAVLVTGSCFLVAEVLHRLGFRDLDETRQPRPAS
jgi:folylpolyglutamate synthase/dihydropteroate synthase